MEFEPTLIAAAFALTYVVSRIFLLADREWLGHRTGAIILANLASYPTALLLTNAVAPQPGPADLIAFGVAQFVWFAFDFAMHTVINRRIRAFRRGAPS